jgi:hypothetical protein
MKRVLSLGAALALILAIFVYALQPGGSFPALDWAKKGSNIPPRVAILLEFGHKDVTTHDYSGSATVTGAKVVHREGYRFRDADKLVGADGWEASSRAPIRAPKGKPAVSKLEPLATVGVVLHLEDVSPDAKVTLKLKNGEKAEVALADVVAGKTQTLWDGTAQVRRVTAALPVAATAAEEDHPAAAYGPDGTLWVAYIAYTNRDTTRRIETTPMKAEPKDFKSLYKPEFADQLLVKSFKDGKWSEPIAITDAKQDLARCAIAANGAGDVWVVYSAHRQEKFALYARKIDAQRKLSGEQLVTDKPAAALTPVVTTDSHGDLWLAYQSWSDQGRAIIDVCFCGQDMKIRSVHAAAGDAFGNCWHPAIAASSRGEIAVAYDCYRNGSYDVMVYLLYRDTNPQKTDGKAIAASPKFEARPSIVYDAQGRLWVAYEEGPENWGKDYGALASGKGNPLYNERSVRVVCVDTDGKVKRTTAELPTSRYDPPVLPFEPVKTSKYERATRHSYPRIGIDGQGRVWLSHRQNFGNRYSSHAGAYWLTFVRRLDGQAWSEPIEVAHSDSLQDHRPVLLPHAGGGLVVIHNTDGRFTTPATIDNQIYASVIDLPTKASALQLVAHDPGQGQMSPSIKAENDAVKRMRDARLKIAGKTYQYLRGEYHRHTEISWDGAPDGTLEDMFRYAIDAAQMDWIGNGDHDNGAGREYTWWLTQKFTDAYHGKAFTTMFTYERSVAYPHGHRNVMFAQRGILTLPRLAPPADMKKAEGGVHPDDAKMLYKYLHQFDGICAGHTSATSMGTDWRDNDPVVEPIVEIYQGDRMSYEMEGAPRAGFDPQSGKDPANVAGWFPKGYINLALQKGYKLSFQASSDHWSTHISYFIILAEGRDRQSLLKAIKQRHCYAATDNILVDFRCGDKIMGDEVVSAGAPKFSIHVAGTDKIAKIDVLRDSEIVETLKPGAREFTGEWTDAAAGKEPHYYYIRVLQTDGEIAWGSPIWVARK